MKTMKKIFLLCLLLSIGYSNTYAQVEGEPTPVSLSNEAQSTYASLLHQLIVNLSKDSYSDKFNPIVSKWYPGNTTIAQAFGVIKNLEFYLKTVHLKPEWRVVQIKWRERVSKSTEKTEVVILLRELEANMQPTAFNKPWTTARGAWLTDIDNYLKK